MAARRNISLGNMRYRAKALNLFFARDCNRDMRLTRQLECCSSCKRATSAQNDSGRSNAESLTADKCARGKRHCTSKAVFQWHRRYLIDGMLNRNAVIASGG